MFIRIRTSYLVLPLNTFLIVTLYLYLFPFSDDDAEQRSPCGSFGVISRCRIQSAPGINPSSRGAPSAWSAPASSSRSKVSHEIPMLITDTIRSLGWPWRFKTRLLEFDQGILPSFLFAFPSLTNFRPPRQNQTGEYPKNQQKSFAPTNLVKMWIFQTKKYTIDFKIEYVPSNQIHGLRRNGSPLSRRNGQPWSTSLSPSSSPGKLYNFSFLFPSNDYRLLFPWSRSYVHLPCLINDHVVRINLALDKIFNH